jgi:hypothetical protein
MTHCMPFAEGIRGITPDRQQRRTTMTDSDFLKGSSESQGLRGFSDLYAYVRDSKGATPPAWLVNGLAGEEVGAVIRFLKQVQAARVA